MTKITKKDKKRIIIGGVAATTGTGAYIVYKIVMSAAKVAFLFL